MFLGYKDQKHVKMIISLLTDFKYPWKSRNEIIEQGHTDSIFLCIQCWIIGKCVPNIFIFQLLLNA